MLAQLELARRMLESSQVEAARRLASTILKAAEEQGERVVQGRALLALAQYDRVLGRFRRAIDAAQRATQLFRLEGDIAGEAQALSLLAHCCNYLGRDEEAVEAALLSVRLGDLLPPGSQQVNLYNYLGVSYLWSQSFVDAQSALERAEALARQYPQQSHVLLPRINLAWLEVLRLFHARYYDAAPLLTSVLEQRLQRCAGLFDEDTPFPGLPGVRAVLQRFGRCTHALLHCWRGEFAPAQQWLDAAQDPTRPGKYAQVANFVVHWVRAELHLARGDLPAAQQEAMVLVQQASVAEFEQMAYVGHMLLIQLHARQGRHDLALAEERSFRRRQLRVRADSLASRHRVVQAQLDIRSSERDLHQLARHAQELERLSFEDALTGIANRRRFELQLTAALAAGGHALHPTCVALMDLDRFKSINDRYSHKAGDDVLRTVAQTIRTAVRDTDLPARLGGDEFVVLFPHSSLEQANAICQRIGQAVAALRWPQWSHELRAGLSVGVAVSRQGDTAVELLQRSDLAMFGVKKIAASPVFTSN